MESSGEHRESEGQASESPHRILASTRRPDGTLRKPVRIRAGYVPQDEVAIYHPRPLRREMASRSHSDSDSQQQLNDHKPKSKSIKRNQRKKEKRLQAVLEREKNSEPNVAQDCGKQEAVTVSESESVSVDSLTSRISKRLDLSADSSLVSPIADSVEQGSEPVSVGQDIDKRIRALKKKIRQTEALQQKTAEQDMKPEQLEKLAKLEAWHRDLKLLEDKKAGTPAA